MAEDRREDVVRILRVDRQLGDLLAVGQAAVRPGESAVAGAVDAVADRQVRPAQPLAARHVDDGGVGGRDRDRADRLRLLLIEDRLPGAPGVAGLPDATVDRADVEDVGLRGDARHRPGAPAAQRADHAPAEIRVEAGAWVRGGCALGRREGECAERGDDPDVVLAHAISPGAPRAARVAPPVTSLSGTACRIFPRRCASRAEH